MSLPTRVCPTPTPSWSRRSWSAGSATSSAERGLSQREAARILDIAQPDLSNLLRGRFRGYSVERLMRMLTPLDCTVSIVVAEKGREAATIPVGAAVTIDKQ